MTASAGGNHSLIFFYFIAIILALWEGGKHVHDRGLLNN